MILVFSLFAVFTVMLMQLIVNAVLILTPVILGLGFQALNSQGLQDQTFSYLVAMWVHCSSFDALAGCFIILITFPLLAAALIYVFSLLDICKYALL